MDDNDPEPAQNFTISFVVNKVQPEDVNIFANQSEAVITIQENDRKCHCMVFIRDEVIVTVSAWACFSGGGNEVNLAV